MDDLEVTSTCAEVVVVVVEEEEEIFKQRSESCHDAQKSPISTQKRPTNLLDIRAKVGALCRNVLAQDEAS
jgi:hypothetical protein